MTMSPPDSLKILKEKGPRFHSERQPDALSKIEKQGTIKR
jgi:hypothetical protein